MNCQYQLELKVSLPKNPEYDPNKVCAHFENHCLLLWRNPEGAPRLKTAKMTLTKNVAQSLIGALTFQRRVCYRIEAACSAGDLWDSLCNARKSTIAYFDKRKKLAVTMLMSLFGGNVSDGNPTERLFSDENPLDESSSGKNSPERSVPDKNPFGGIVSREQPSPIPQTPSLSRERQAPAPDSPAGNAWDADRLFGDAPTKENEPLPQKEEKPDPFQMFD